MPTLRRATKGSRALNSPRHLIGAIQGIGINEGRKNPSHGCCLIHHLSAVRLVAERGKIELLRESLNVIAAAQALKPNGVAALQGVSTEIHSTSPEYRS